MAKEQKSGEHPRAPWTARRVTALAGVILLLVLYASTMVFALMDSPHADGLLMASVACTVFVPVLLYAMQLVARNVRARTSLSESARPGETENDEDARTESRKDVQ